MYLIELPSDLLALICLELDSFDLPSLILSCCRFHKITKDEKFQKSYGQYHHFNLREMYQAIPELLFYHACRLNLKSLIRYCVRKYKLAYSSRDVPQLTKEERKLYWTLVKHGLIGSLEGDQQHLVNQFTKIWEPSVSSPCLLQCLVKHQRLNLVTQGDFYDQSHFILSGLLRYHQLDTLKSLIKSGQLDSEDKLFSASPGHRPVYYHIGTDPLTLILDDLPLNKSPEDNFQSFKMMFEYLNIYHLVDNYLRDHGLPRKVFLTNNLLILHFLTDYIFTQIHTSESDSISLTVFYGYLVNDTLLEEMFQYDSHSILNYLADLKVIDLESKQVKTARLRGLIKSCQLNQIVSPLSGLDPCISPFDINLYVDCLICAVTESVSLDGSDGRCFNKYPSYVRHQNLIEMLRFLLDHSHYPLDEDNYVEVMISLYGNRLLLVPLLDLLYQYGLKHDYNLACPTEYLRAAFDRQIESQLRIKYYGQLSNDHKFRLVIDKHRGDLVQYLVEDGYFLTEAGKRKLIQLIETGHLDHLKFVMSHFP